MSEKFNNKNIKDYYSKIIETKYNNDYEFERWFQNARLRLDYYMMSRAIQNCLKGEDFKKCLEVGPGPGTWTKFLYRKNPKATFTLVDISEEMRNQFALEMRNQVNINYQISDFLNFESEETFDFFFSSRALEYVDDKEIFFSSLHKKLDIGSTGVVITKNPHHIASIKRARPQRAHHTGQIDPIEIKTLLKKVGFSEIEVYPCIVRIAHFERITSRLAEKIFERVYRKKSNKLPFFAESYVVKFKK